MPTPHHRDRIRVLGALRAICPYCLSPAEIALHRNGEGSLHRAGSPYRFVGAGGRGPCPLRGDDKYFDFVDALFSTQADWAFVDDPAAALRRIATQAGFTEQSFERALANQRVLDGIQWVARRAREKFCVDGTPTYFINGVVHHSEMSPGDLDKLLEPLLQS